MTLYQPFLDYAIALLQERLDLQPYPIPEGFEFKTAITGKGQRQEEVNCGKLERRTCKGEMRYKF
jgi:phycoerythrobilin:ferredoxin oxidoreductase